MKFVFRFVFGVDGLFFLLLLHELMRLRALVCELCD